MAEECEWSRSSGHERDSASTRLTHQDCLDLLAAGGLGRIAVNLRALPAILPVHYWLDGDDVVFTVIAGAPADRATHETVIAFQTDGHDGSGELWSISLTGVARHVAESPRSPGWSPPWPSDADADMVRTVAVATEYMTGHRSHDVWPPGDGVAASAPPAVLGGSVSRSGSSPS
jgi:nitroimidazol reductase NimA-like FMN-containing flavoprotein (pyridoxamine 5'-phosphate oxidase superfamily)